MREIKLRAWSIKKRKYLDIDTLYCANGKVCGIVCDGVVYDTDDVVLEQDTGLKDKNGEKICEGDIVFFFTEHFDKSTGGFDGEDEHNAIVEWFDNGFAFMDKVPYDPNIECEVIGNIHESPELLGGEE